MQLGWERRVNNELSYLPGVEDGTSWCKFRIEVQKSIIWSLEELSGLYIDSEYSFA